MTFDASVFVTVTAGARQRAIARLSAPDVHELPTVWPPPPVSVTVRNSYDDSAVVASFPGSLLVVVGSEDELLPADDAHELAASAPNGRFVLIDGAGHLVSLDDAPAFNDVLADFLEELA